MSKLQQLATEHKNSLALGGATLVCALGIGYVMQYGLALPGQDQTAAASTPIEITEVTPTSSAVSAPRPPITDAESLEPALEGTPVVTADLPADAPLGDSLTDEAIDLQPLKVAAVVPVVPQATPAPTPTDEPDITLAAAEDISDADTPLLPGEEASNGFACEIEMQAAPAAGAMVDVLLTAPCHVAERVTIHHQGLMFTEVTDAEGALSISVPALAETALFIASFASGDGATAMTSVPTLQFYDRVAVQWKGDTGLGLHALEFAAEYFAPGHIWSGAEGDMAATARGESGFLTPLGDATTPDALRAEIYTFPSGSATRSGDVILSVEAEITSGNCDQQVEAQTLEIRKDDELRTRNLTLHMPGCDATGDFLVLKNLVEDLTIAAR